MRVLFVYGLCFFSCLTALPVKAQFSYQFVEVLYDSAWTYKNLQLIPIRFKAGRGGSGSGDGEYISLAEAMAQKKAFVKELPPKVGSYKGAVTITNKTKKTILIHSGDMIQGGKQDRVLPKTTTIAPGQKRELLTTFCIEKDRWDDKAKPFFYGGSGDMDLRKSIDVKKTQGAVWKEIDRQYTLRSASSKTWAYLKLHDDTARIKDYARYFRAKFDSSGGGFAGFLFVTGTTIMSVELFSKSDYTATSFDAMVATYINSVSVQPNPPLVSQGRQKTFLDNVLTTRDAQYKLIRKQGVQHKQDGDVLHMVIYGTDY
jgi:hypothetical protein